MYLTIHEARHIKSTALSKVSQSLVKKKLEFALPALMVKMDSVGSVKFVEIMSRHHETYKKKALKLIKPIQDHLPVSWVQKICGFGFRCLKHI